VGCEGLEVSRELRRICKYHFAGCQPMLERLVAADLPSLWVKTLPLCYVSRGSVANYGLTRAESMAS